MVSPELRGDLIMSVNEIRELTAEEMECVTGGMSPVALFPLIRSMYWALAEAAGVLCVQDETGNGTTVGNCDTF
jgi:hypothetical protein